MKKTAFILSFILLLAACNNERISRGKFVTVLTEMYLYENELSFTLGRKADSTHIYYSIFEKHGITQAQFDSTMSYYSWHPRQLKDIYEDVNKRLVAVKDNADKAIAQAEIKNNLWKGDNKYTFKEEGKPQTVDFEVKVTEPGIYEVNATARYFPDDSTVSPHMLAYLSSNNKNDTIDLQRVDFMHEDNEKDYSMTFVVKDRNIEYIKGYWLNVDDLDKKSMQHIQVHKLKIKRIGETGTSKKQQETLPLLDLNYLRYLLEKDRCWIEDTIYVRMDEQKTISETPAVNATPQAEPMQLEQAAQPQIEIIHAKNRRPLPHHQLRRADTARLR